MDVEKWSSLEELMAQIEEGWSLFDELFDILNREGGWDNKHGKDWTFADVPYHLAYFDRDVVIEPIRAGADIPEDQRWVLRTVKETNAWNERRFNERPAGQSVAQSLEEMRSVRDELREIAAGMNNEDLDGKVWFPLGFFRGWRSVRLAMEQCRNHTVGEFIQLRTWMKRDTPVPTAGLMHSWLQAVFGLLQGFANPAAAGDRPFTIVWNIEADGGGPWTIHMEDGACTVTEGRTLKADFEMSLGPQYIGVLIGIQNPVKGILTRKIKVRGYRHMGKLGKLFAMPDPDTVFEPLEAI